MRQDNQHKSFSLMSVMKRLLTAAVAVYLLATLANWIVGLPVKAVPVAEAAPAVASPSPTPATEWPSLNPPAATEPAADGGMESPSNSAPALTTPEPPPMPGPETCTDAMQFLADTTVPDGTVVGPNEPFTKAWRVRNTGSCDWVDYRVVPVAGEPAGALARPIPDTLAGQEVVLYVSMLSPGEPGRHTSYWQVQSPDGSVVGKLTCVIVVQDANSKPAAEERTEQPTPIPPPAPPAAIDEERWIDVDLSQQVLTAYEGHTPVHTTLVSTGLPGTPTPVGQFRIWVKFRYDDMVGADYHIKDVPYVMYFHAGYGLHGVTWHGNFGHPMSHGCVNLPTPEAEWLFNWAGVGTLVNIHE